MTAQTVKLVLVGLPRVLRDVMEAAVQTEADLEVVAETPDASGLAGLIAETGAHVVVADAEAVDEPRALRLVASVSVRIVTLSGDGRRASLYECRPERRDVGQIEPQTLIGLLKRGE
jgi:DNA-binding NarL/FixJ family response regulator